MFFFCIKMNTNRVIYIYLTLLVGIFCVCNPISIMFSNNAIVNRAKFDQNGTLTFCNVMYFNVTACPDDVYFKWTFEAAENQNYILHPKYSTVFSINQHLSASINVVVLKETSYSFHYPFYITFQAMKDTFVVSKVVQEVVEELSTSFEPYLNVEIMVDSLDVRFTDLNQYFLNVSADSNVNTPLSSILSYFYMLFPQQVCDQKKIDAFFTFLFVKDEKLFGDFTPLLMKYEHLVEKQTFLVESASSIMIHSPNSNNVSSTENVIVCASSVACNNIRFNGSFPEVVVISNLSVSVYEKLCIQSVPAKSMFQKLVFTAYCESDSGYLFGSISFDVYQPPDSITLHVTPSSGFSFQTNFTFWVANYPSTALYYTWTFFVCGREEIFHFISTTNNPTLTTQLCGCHLSKNGEVAIHFVQVTAVTSTGKVSAEVDVGISNLLFDNRQLEKMVFDAKNDIKNINTSDIGDSAIKIINYIDRVHMQANKTGIFDDERLAYEVEQLVPLLEEMSEKIFNAQDSITFINTLQSLSKFGLKVRPAIKILNLMKQPINFSDTESFQNIVKTLVNLRTNVMNSSFQEEIKINEVSKEILNEIAFMSLKTLTFNQSIVFSEADIEMKVMALKIEDVFQDIILDTGIVSLPPSLLRTVNSSFVGVKTLSLSNHFAVGYDRTNVVDVSIFADNRVLSVDNMEEFVEIRIKGKGICQYYNETNNEWQMNGVSNFKEEEEITICLTNHLSIFALKIKLSRHTTHPLYLTFVVVPVFAVAIWLRLKQPKKQNNDDAQFLLPNDDIFESNV
eukprot:TRINITY_DN3226_c6_g14_i1.p1 TRINITY_DN3226_c6_g14~~TRINITY_DN3226_c6_g14_i1.p1  ORF type:complete len:793 (-),score=208.43 TRINITY_DN3226_c6_g14_i1:1643-4021(-)